VADLAGPAARVKWPNDVLLDGGKLAGVLVEARPGEGWSVLGIGVNVSASLDSLPPGSATLGRPPGSLEGALRELLGALELRIEEGAEAVVAALAERDALMGEPVSWAGGEGVGAGIAPDGSLLVRLADGTETRVSSGEVVRRDRHRP
jgi:BirA family biotin operon repressor/biotin-[acetyl-CoA-carboxylase] ligase